MSDAKTPKAKDAVSLKDAGILVGWIVGLLLLAGLSWFLTQPARDRFLLDAVNRVLEQSDDSRRLGEAVAPGTVKAGSLMMGSWFTVTGASAETRAYVFAFIGGGTFFPCAAVVSPEGKVEAYIPLNNYGARVLKQISPGILGIYTRRIEGAK